MKTKASIEAALESIIGLIEAIGSERSDLLPLLLDITSNSPFRFAIEELARVFDAEEKDLEVAYYSIANDLDTLENSRKRFPDQVLDNPNVDGMLHLCRARLARVSGTKRNRKLLGIERRLVEMREKQSTQRWIEAFIA